MAKITTGSTYGINARQTSVARYFAEGKSEEDVILLMFGGPLTDAEHTSALKQIRKWMRLPAVAACYRDIVREIAMPAYGKAMRTITTQLDDVNPWVAQGAAREVLTRFGPAVMGESDKQIVVRVEGMPAIGMPPAETDENPTN